MADFYIDKRNTEPGNGTIGNPWKDLNKCFSSAYAPSGSNILLAPGSGPYLASDFTSSGIPYFYPTQPLGLKTIYDLGGNTLQFDKFLVGDAYKWIRSTATGKEDWWYVTNNNMESLGLIDPKSVIVNTDWNDKDTSLTPLQATSYKSNNYGWGDFDSLGFNTVYVVTATGEQPTEVWAAQSFYNVRISSNLGPFLIKNGQVRGSTECNIVLSSTCDLDNVSLINAASHGVDASNSTTITNSRFINCGHRGVLVTATTPKIVNIIGNYFEKTHLALKISSNFAHTVTFKNNVTKDMYAGGIQHDTPLTTLIESNNQWHLDQMSSHGGKAIAFTTTTRQWTTTASTDLPASTSTALTTSVNPQITSSGKILSTSPCIDKGAYISGVNMEGQTDPWGKKVYGVPNIGADQGAGAPKSGSRQILQLGSNRGFFS